LSGKTDTEHPAGDIGRVATPLQDAADNPTAPRGTVRVEMGNAWNWTTVTSSSGTAGEFPLYYGTQDFIKPDFEQVSIGPSGIRTFAHRIANSLSTNVNFDGVAELLGNLTLGSFSGADIAAIDSAILGAMDDAKIYSAVNGAMADAGFNWCDRCSVLALHEPGAPSVPSDWSPELFKACRDNTFLAVAIENLPPEPNLNLERIHCSACPAGTARNSDYSACVPCSGVVVGDQCIPCPPDIVLNGSEITAGATFTYAPTTPQAADDVCPNILWVEVQDVPAMFNLHSDLDELVATPIFPVDDLGTCTRQHTLHLATQSGSDAFAYSLQQANGDFDRKCTASGCFATCTGTPATAVKRTQSLTNVMFGIPTAALDSLEINATVVQGRIN